MYYYLYKHDNEVFKQNYKNLLGICVKEYYNFAQPVINLVLQSNVLTRILGKLGLKHIIVLFPIYI